MKRIDLNVDIGEGFPWDRELLEFATSANVCCGAHAGSPELALETVAMCRDMGVRAGAHPGYPDREHFGRRSRDAWDKDLRDGFFHDCLGQVLPLEGFVSYIKPHGGFYNDSAKGGPVAEVLGGVVMVYGLPLMGLAGSRHDWAAGSRGLIREGFADRAYTSDGFLVPRSEEGAVLGSLEEKVAQALWLAGRVDSICLHGDEADSVEVIRAVRGALEDAEWEVCAFEPKRR